MAIASFKAGETISAGDAVYTGSTGLIYKAIAVNQAQASVAGIAIDSGTVGSLIRVNTDAIYSSYTGLIPGETRYLSVFTSGQLVSYSGFVNELSATALDGAYLEVVGRSITTSGVEVETGKPFFLNNPSSILLLETGTGYIADAMLLEDGSYIDLESAT